ncbi:MAG: ArsR/SmtB family transcription factor [Alphaproteobacteria bacterium]
MQAKNTHRFAALEHNAEAAEALLKQLANAKRLMIVCSLTGGERTVSELVDITGLSHSAVSQHLAKMREATLVSSEKRGQMVYYRICSMQAQTIVSVLYHMYCNKG